ncbi:hypothetical protein [Lignipirellula cremea]|uniref:Uncharacterized protein n=1 Tax=Lignipirellula cremea TaxID=2528010 RepID=A0A518DNP3_9BACT|nr:hypothetical protein [Lignipirellula cremea]QDU93457.1 hypothetical protein Pla8534_12370 [Lignipirellula cremea]
MTLSQSPTLNIRRLAETEFYQLGAPMDEVRSLEERVRIDGGKVVARTYRAAGMMAMWMIDIGIVQFYGPEGEMLRTVNLFQQEQSARAAA